MSLYVGTYALLPMYVMSLADKMVFIETGHLNLTVLDLMSTRQRVADLGHETGSKKALEDMAAAIRK